MVDIERLRDPEQLRSLCRAYAAAHRVLTSKIEALVQELALLKGLDAAQAALDLPDIQIEASEKSTSNSESTPEAASDSKLSGKPQDQEKRPRRGHGPKPQPLLPFETLEHVLEGPPQACPLCEAPMSPWAGQFEEFEEITVVETTFKVICHQRQKYRCCECHGAVVTAPGPDRLIPGGRYSVDFAVLTAIEKFCDHRVPRRHAQPPKGRRGKSCCMEDEGRPLGIGVQAQVSNHLELRGSRVRVVCVEGKGVARPRQVRSKKTSVSEPLMTCREEFTRRRNRAGWLARDEPRESLLIDWAASGMKAA